MSYPKPTLLHEFDPATRNYPTTAWEGIELLEAGNQQIVAFRLACDSTGTPGEPPIIPMSPRQLGLGIPADDLGFPKQAPWAVFLGCSDARVPAEMLFGQGFNDIFDIRVAGNVLGESEQGSLDYALDHFTEDLSHIDLPRLVLVVVLGHRGCGAVKAVVDHYQSFGLPLPVEQAMAQLGDSPLHKLIQRIYRPAFAEVAKEYPDPSEKALRGELIDRTVLKNAELTARQIAGQLPKDGGVRAAFGVYDPTTFHVTADDFTILEKRERGLFDLRSRLEAVDS